MIAFALVASADKFEHAALGYLVAAGVIAFVYALLQIVMEFIGSPSVQFDVGFEFLVNVFLLSSASAAAAAREEVTGMSSGEEGRVIGPTCGISSDFASPMPTGNLESSAYNIKWKCHRLPNATSNCTTGQARHNT
eukprot:jgi/Pico_ML_1/53619/g4140.t1